MTRREDSGEQEAPEPWGRRRPGFREALGLTLELGAAILLWWLVLALLLLCIVLYFL